MLIRELSCSGVLTLAASTFVLDFDILCMSLSAFACALVWIGFVCVLNGQMERTNAESTRGMDW
jgi:hypothetical protein